MKISGMIALIADEDVVWDSDQMNDIVYVAEVVRKALPAVDLVTDFMSQQNQVCERRSETCSHGYALDLLEGMIWNLVSMNETRLENEIETLDE